MTLWLARDARRGARLVGTPDVPHVREACAVPVVFAAAEIRGLVAPPTLRAEFGR